MSGPGSHPDFPDRADREALNAALLATGAETGFWDDDGRAAPWPDDIDAWTPSGSGAQSPLDEIF
jgi:hypothetical protein